MKVRLTVGFVALVMVAAACSSGASEPQAAPTDEGSTATAVQAAPDTTAEESTPVETSPAEDSEDNAFAAAAAGGASATLTLENG